MEYGKKGHHNRVLVIGLDGATFDVLEQWLHDGTLPTIAQLCKKGTFGRLTSTVPPLTAPAWSSFMTGKNPGKHGILQFFSVLSESADGVREQRVPVSTVSIRGEALWGVLSRQGYRVGMVNVPLTYPPHPVNGIMITGMLTPPGVHDFTYPPELASDLGDYKIDLDYFLGDEMGHHEYLPSLDQVVHELRNVLELRGGTAQRLLAQEAWDFFMVVFTGTDRLGHFLWPYHFEPKGPVVGDGNGSLCRSVCDYYSRLDAIISDLVETAGEDVTVLLMSDHGMGPASEKVVYINQWLQAEGFLKLLPLRKSWKNPNRWFAAFGLSRDKLARLKDLVPAWGSLGRLSTKAAQISLPIDHSKTRAYFRTIYVSVGGIYIEGHCKQSPQSYEELCNAIIRGIEQIRDPETGESVVELAARSQDVYSGGALVDAPDIVVVLGPKYRCNHRLGTGSIVNTRVETRYDQRVVGDHRPEGIFVASGAGIRQNAGEIAGLRIEDLAPTILYLLDAEIPSDVDGRVVWEAIEPSVVQERPPRYGSVINDTAAVSRQVELSPAEQEGILSRLRGLGYIE